ncbi:MAG: DUF3526 domain-containing protein [Planctomycetota bacterium]
MIRTALGLELRSVLRSPLRLVAVVFVVAAGVFAILQGQRDVGRWQEAVDAGRAEQEESLAETRAHFAAGRSGPEERPWVDLSKPRWQDWYAATRLAREPAPLAGIAFASAEAGAVAVRINRYADPLLAQGSKIDNPELAAAGGLDLVAVLALLLPLLILALGVEIGGHERASGILPLVRVQSGRDGAWIAARCLAVGLFGAGAGLLLTAVAWVVGAADAGSALALAGVVTAYAAVWTAVLAAVAHVARHPSQSAVALGSIWIVLCVLVPAVGVERSAALAADDFALDLTVDARDASRGLDELEDDALFAALLQRFPELEQVVPEDRAAAADTARAGLRIVGLEERMARREERGQAQTRLVRWMSAASPAVAFTHALERLAGRHPDAARDHRRAVVAAAASRMETYIAAAWTGIPLDAADFEALHASTPERLEGAADAAWSEAAVLVAWALVFLGVAFLSARGDRRGGAPHTARAGAPPASQAAPATRTLR